MRLPKELENLPTINVTYVIDGKKSQVFFDFDKRLRMQDKDEVPKFLMANDIRQLTEQFLGALEMFLWELPEKGNKK